MVRARLGLFLSLVFLIAALAAGIYLTRHRPRPAENAFVDSRVCADCHPQIAQTYGLTGMGRSFSRTAADRPAGEYFHQPSGIHYAMAAHDGKYWQRRWQSTTSDGEELSVDYVLGSGNHAVTYLHRTQRGTLIELPLGRYAENRGTFAMNPGYDTDHFIRGREISYDCMFCHNGYPAISSPGEDPIYPADLPEGIDCQRCHGPGANHIKATTPESRRSTIINPARLNQTQKMEVCMQCHLQTTSSLLPSSIVRFDREPFSYRAGEPLAAFRLTFDKVRQAPGSARVPPDPPSFEIDSSVYRLRQSQCFLKSQGALTCLTCHDPHNIPRGADATRRYNSVCRQCHATVAVAAPSHSGDPDCVSCHMPKRRTTDVVHVAMTDHLIQRRRPSGDLLAPLHEINGQSYRGTVASYYPAEAPALYAAVAQVRDGSNLSIGIPQLAAVIEKEKPQRPEPYRELGDAWYKAGDKAKAVAPYEEAVRLAPDDGPTLRRLGVARSDAGILNRAVTAAPQDPKSWYELGLVLSQQGRKPDAIEKFRKSIELDPDFAWAYNGLGMALADTNQPAPAEEAYRTALRLQPDYEEAMANLAQLIGPAGKLAEAIALFERALRIKPSDANTRANYAVALSFANRFADAQHEAARAIQTDPTLPEPHELLGGLLASENRLDAAIQEFSAAIKLKPDFARAQLGLGTALLRKGDKPGAIEHLRLAAASSDPDVRQQAAEALSKLK